MNVSEDAPFPLDGGRAGDGGDTPSARSRHRSGSLQRARRLRQDQTWPERLLWNDLRKLGMNFRRQVPLGRFIVDFAHHEARLIIEVDGPHHDSPEGRHADAERTAWLEGQGYRVIRFGIDRVKSDREAVIEEIRSATLSPPSQPFPHQGGRALWRARDQWVRDDEN